MSGIRAMVASDAMRSRGYVVQVAWMWALIGVGVNLLQDGPIFALVAVPASTGFSMLISSFAQDEAGDWQLFRLTTPLDRREVVWGRVAFVTLAVTLSAVYALVLALVSMAIGQGIGMEGLNLEGRGVSSREVVWATLMLTAGGTLACGALMAPLAFKNGMQKSLRTMPLLFAGIVTLVAYLVSPAGPWGTVPMETLGRLIDALGGVAGLGCLLLGVGLALWTLSGAVAARLYESRQF